MRTRRLAAQIFGTAVILGMTVPSAVRFYSVDHDMSRAGILLWFAAVLVPALVAALYFIERGDVE